MLQYRMAWHGSLSFSTASQRPPPPTTSTTRSEFTLWALAGGQLVISTDIRGLSPLQREVLLNPELLAVFNDSLKTVGARET